MTPECVYCLEAMWQGVVVESLFGYDGEFSFICKGCVRVLKYKPQPADARLLDAGIITHD